MRIRTWVKLKAIFIGFFITFLLMIVMCAAIFVYIQLPMKSVQKARLPYKHSEVFIVHLEDTTGTVEFDDRVVKRYVDKMGIVHETRKNIYEKESW